MFVLTDEVELEQSCQERRLVWSVKIRRVRLIRCVFRYGPRDGMTYSAVKPIDQYTRTHDRTRVHIKSIVGIEGHFPRTVLVLTGLKYLCNTSESKQGGLIITGGEVQWHC